jgi:amidase
MRNALHALVGKLDRAGARVDDETNGLPDLAAAHRAYTKMLGAIVTRGTPGARPIDAHAWMELLDEQMRLARRWHAVFQEVDVVLAPPFGIEAFPHDDEPDWGKRTHVIDGAETRYGAQVAWPGIATYPGLPATVAPIAKTKRDLPIGVQIMGDMYADRTTLAFAALMERDGLTLPL